MRTFLIALLLSLALPASATDRLDKIQKLMEAQGLLEMWDQQIQLSKDQGRKQAQQMLDQVLASVTPTPEVEASLRDASTEFMKALEPPWTAQDVVNVWAEKYGAQFSDEELDGLLAYYTSSLGRKDVTAAQAALPEFTSHFLELSKPIMEAATQTYVQRLQDAMRQANAKSE